MTKPKPIVHLRHPKGMSVETSKGHEFIAVCRDWAREDNCVTDLGLVTCLFCKAEAS